MSDGYRKLIINTQERAVSTDINRLQAFKGADVSEIFRNLLDTYPASDDDAIGIISAPNTLQSPLRAEIVGQGLLVKPQAGSLDLLVDGGLLFAIVPDGASDESNYKMINDTGVLAPGGLQMTANPAGSTRIDVIECRINPGPATVSDSRDIFDVTSGLFTAQSVVKESKGRLEYRVRAGVAGSGFPGTASGWLPLTVASLPAATTTNDTITFWDVRPLTVDRVNGPSNLPTDSAWTKNSCTIKATDNPGAARLEGYCEAQLFGRRLGGLVRRGTPGTDAAYANVEDVANQEPGFAFNANATDIAMDTFVYLATPYDLPRWARYTDGPSGRVPRSTKGLLVVSNKAPDAYGRPASAVQMPASTGLGAVASFAAICMIATCSVDGAPLDGSGAGSSWWYSAEDDTTPLKVDGVVTSGVVTFALEPDTHFPASAKSLRIQFTLAATVPANTAMAAWGIGITPGVYVRLVGEAGGTKVYASVNDFVNPAGSGAPVIQTVDVTIPVPNVQPSPSFSADLQLRLQVSTAYTSAEVQSVATVIGWEL